MTRTGHRSADGIRAYKRISEEQQKALFDVLNNPQKEEVEYPSPPKKPRESPAINSTQTATGSMGIPNIPAMNFSGCTGKHNNHIWNSLIVTVYDKTRHMGYFAKIAIAIYISSTTLELTLLQV